MLNENDLTIYLFIFLFFLIGFIFVIYLKTQINHSFFFKIKEKDEKKMIFIVENQQVFFHLYKNILIVRIRGSIIKICDCIAPNRFIIIFDDLYNEKYINYILKKKCQQKVQMEDLSAMMNWQ